MTKQLKNKETKEEAIIGLYPENNNALNKV